MRKTAKKVVGALGAGMAAGASLGVLGTYMFSSNPKFKKGAKKARTESSLLFWLPR